MRIGTTIGYISHLLRVAGIALEYGADEDEAIAALLHDAVEDGGGKARALEIRQRFGDRVAAIVEGCSDTDVTPKPPSAERKRRYREHLRKEQDASRPVYAIVAQDEHRIHFRCAEPPKPNPEEIRRRAARPYLFIEDADALFAEYASRGVEFTRALAKTPWRSREFVVKDCDGRLLAFGANRE